MPDVLDAELDALPKAQPTLRDTDIDSELDALPKATPSFSATDIDAELDALPKAKAPVEPGRETSVEQAGGLGRYAVGKVLHPIKAAETGVEQLAIQTGLAAPGSRLLWSPARQMETPMFKAIPRTGTIPLPKEPGLARTGAQVARAVTGATNLAVDFINFMQTPEGLASLGLAKIPRYLSRLILGDWATEMARQTPEQLQASIEAFKSGDIQGGIEHAGGGLAGTLLPVAIAKHIGEPAGPGLRRVPAPSVEPVAARPAVAPVAPEGKAVTPAAEPVAPPVEAVPIDTMDLTDKKVYGPGGQSGLVTYSGTGIVEVDTGTGAPVQWRKADLDRTRLLQDYPELAKPITQKIVTGTEETAPDIIDNLKAHVGEEKIISGAGMRELDPNFPKNGFELNQTGWPKWFKNLFTYKGGTHPSDLVDRLQREGTHMGLQSGDDFTTELFKAFEQRRSGKKVATREAKTLAQEEAEAIAAGRKAQIEEVQFENEERAAIAEADKLGAKAKVVDTLPSEGEPFARAIPTNQNIATIAKDGTVLINRPVLNEWLRSVDPAKRAEAVRTLIHEEFVHNRVRRTVGDAGAEQYFRNATALEQALARRRYGGPAEGRPAFTDAQLGHEMIRARIQQLAGMTPREVFGLRGAERLTTRAILALERIIAAVRRAFGTKASDLQRDMLRRVQDNLDAAKAAERGEARKPAGPELPEGLVPKDQYWAGVEAGIKKHPLSYWGMHTRMYWDVLSGELNGLVQSALRKLQFVEPGASAELVKIHGVLTTVDSLVKDAVELAKDPKAFADRDDNYTDAIRAIVRTEPGIAELAHAKSEPDFDQRVLNQYDAVSRNILETSFADVLADWPEYRAEAYSKNPAFGGAVDTYIRNKPDLLRKFKEEGLDLLKLSTIEDYEPEPPAAFLRRAGELPLEEAKPGEERKGPKLPAAVPFESLSKEARRDALRRTAVTPADIDRRAPDVHRPISVEESTDIKRLSSVLTEGARVRTATPSVTRRVTAVENTQTGNVDLVSTFKEHGITMLLDPGRAGLRKPHVRLSELLTRPQYRILDSYLLEQPVKDFRQRFDTVEQYDAQFRRDVAAEAESRVRGIEERPAGVEAGRPVAVEAPSQPGVFEAGEPLADAEAGSLYEHLYDTVGKLENAQDVQLALDDLRDKPNRVVASAYNKIYSAIRAANPELSPEQAFDRLLNDVYQGASEAADRQAFVARALERNKAVVPGAVRTVAQGEPPAAFLRKATDRWEKLKDQAAALFARRSTFADVTRWRDGADTIANNNSEMAKVDVQIASGMGKVARAADTLRRKQAVAIVQSGGSSTILRNYIALAGQGIARARALGGRAGRLWERAAQELKAIAEGALRNLGDPMLLRTAREVRSQLDTEYAFERRNGSNLRYSQDYVPGRYDAELFNDNAVMFGEQRILGRQFRKPKTFPSYWDAIAEGPYLPKNLDAADLVGHRVRQGQRELQKGAWLNRLKRVNDPDSSEPIVRDLVPSQTDPRQLVSPSPEYELFSLGHGKQAVAVRQGYMRLMENLTARSQIAQSVPGHAALWTTGLLKHGVILILDTFHPGRLGQYALALMGRRAGYEAGYHALEVRPSSLPAAVRNGMVDAESARWAQTPIEITLNGRRQLLPRNELLELGQREGLNVGRITDAMYKHFYDAYPFIGRFNRWVFDRFTRGLMAQAFVTEFERLNAARPGTEARALMKPIARDINVFMGNLGRQGLIKNPTLRDITQIALLAPQWFESLAQKEIRFVGRLAAAPFKALQGDIPLGTLGRAMGRGLAAYFVLTQAINLITRRQLTFQNEEEGHKLDAWIPDFTGKTKGFWLSPLSVFAEVMHDIVRYGETKPTAYEAVQQIGENKLGPWGRLMMVLATRKTARGQSLTGTGQIVGEAAKQLAPAPISLGRYAQAAGHAVAPDLVPPVPPGQLQRQTFGSAGIKIEPRGSDTGLIARKAKAFLAAEGITRPTVELTDDPSYMTLRQAARNGDAAQVNRIYDKLLETRTEKKVRDAIHRYVNHPFTGSKKLEKQFMDSLTDRELNAYYEALDGRQKEADAIFDLLR